MRDSATHFGHGRARVSVQRHRIRSQKSIAASVRAGALPVAKTPVEELWVKLIHVNEELAEIIGRIRSPADAEQAADRIVAKANVTQRDAAITNMLGRAVAEKLQVRIVAAKRADPFLSRDPFRIASEIRAAGDTKVTVLLRNNRSLAGPSHQQMMRRLQQAASAQHMESLIDGDEYRVLLAPVNDLNRFIASIDFGTVSERNDAARTFTLTINSDAFPAMADVGMDPSHRGPGRPGPGRFVPGRRGPAGNRAGGAGMRPGFGNRPAGARMGLGGGDASSQTEAIVKRRTAGFMKKMEGLENCVTIALVNGPKLGTPMHKEIMLKVRKATLAKHFTSFTVNNVTYIVIGGVTDFDTVANSVDLGKTEKVDRAERTIRVVMEAG